MKKTKEGEKETVPRFRDPDQPVEDRIEDLLARMTIEEKVSQMVHRSAAIERLGIPAYNWWNEACHGIGRAGRATVFPQVIGWAATWNRNLVREASGMISDEARAKHNAFVASGRRGQYTGLTFWTPNINIFRDPRWGRGQETYGEDPYLTAELASQTVLGLQGEDVRYLKTAACAKHYAVHSGPESLRHTFDAVVSAKDLHETYLPAFKRLAETGVEAFMGAYNRTLGEPCCAHPLLMGQILRGEWGFEGHYVSDCGAIDDFHLYHGVTKDKAESAAMAVRAGCDLNCGCTYDDLLVSLKEGLLSEAEIDRSLRRLLRTRFKLGLFDPPEAIPWSRHSVEMVGSPKHRSCARQMARESIVLLKNRDNVLPLPEDAEHLLVVGPTAASTSALLGNYYGVNDRMVTILEGIVATVSPATRVDYRQGCPLLSAKAPGIDYTWEPAAEADAVIAVMGLDHSLEGEEGDTVASPTGGDRDEIELPAVQMDFLRELRRHARKLVLVVTGGSAVAIPEAHEMCDAVVYAWYPGCEGGNAVADVLFGKVNPSGRMPVSVPMRTKDLPPFTDYAMDGRTYRFAKIPPLYPFGFGLSYSRIQYGPPVRGRGKGDTVEFRIPVHNAGTRDVEEVVQCYVIPPVEIEDAPKATLVGFEKVSIGAGEEAMVGFSLGRQAFAVYRSDGRAHIPEGTFRIVFGSASPTQRSRELGAPDPVVILVKVIPSDLQERSIEYHVT